MKLINYSVSIVLLVAFTVASCVDKDYDLSDIDTTTQIKVENLVVPFNLDVIKLSDIIEVKEGSEISEVTLNGKTFYAVNKSGDFTSSSIRVAAFSAQEPSVESSVFAFRGLPAEVSGDVKLPLTDKAESEISYVADDIDKAVVSLTALYLQPTNIELEFESADYSAMEDVTLTDISIDFLKGLVVVPDPTGVVSYNQSTGLLTISEVRFNHDGYAKVLLPTTGIENMQANGYGLDSNHSLRIDQTIALNEADINISNPSALPTDITVSVNYRFPRLDFTSFSGEIQYTLDGITIDPIVINDIPEFLASEETNLILNNPQIYMALSNPVGNYGLYYQCGLSITPVHDYNSPPGEPMELDNGSFSVGATPVDALHNFCLSPFMPADISEEFSQDITHVKFSSLSNVIAGAGIPKELYINILNPEIPVQPVTRFALDTEIPGVEGNWQFLAPLAMKPGSGSRIVYTDRETGWNDEDVDAITITHLTVSLEADNNLPLDALLSGAPLDIDGNPISGVTIHPVTLTANTQEQKVEIVVEGEVTHLDGFEFTATIDSSSGTVIAPDQTLSLKNIRGRITGFYTKKL